MGSSPAKDRRKFKTSSGTSCRVGTEILEVDFGFSRDGDVRTHAAMSAVSVVHHVRHVK
jgi:hypothetical protein